MLTITLEKQEFFDERLSEFFELPQLTLQLEHSLVSLSKWESRYEKPFLDKKEKTDDEIKAYVFYMILSPEVQEDVLLRLTEEDYFKIRSYIDAKMTATTFSERQVGPSREIITSELIYFWMITFHVPIECENWHLNRLLTLIRVCNIKNQTPKKMNKAELAARNRELNARRRAQFGTRG